MNPTTAPKHADEALITGGLLVLLSVLANEWVLAFLLSPDGELGSGTTGKVRLFQAALLVPGILFIVSRNRFAPTPNLRMPARILYATKWIFLKLGMVLFVFALLELGAQALATRFEGRVTGEGDAAFTFSESYGFVLRPNVVLSARKEIDGKLVYNTRYAIDAQGRRATPDAHPNEPKDTALLFFGGSYTFGYGVGDDETLPYYAGLAMPNTTPYNYGVSGYGPQQILIKLQQDSFEEDRGAKRTTAIFSYVPDHVRRVIGAMRAVNGFARHFPSYALSADGTLNLEGSFRNAHPRRAGLYQWLGAEGILRALHWDIPLRITGDHLELTARILEEARDTFQRKFGSESFYVLLWPAGIWPGAERHKAETRRMIPFLERAGIRYLDYIDLVDMQDTENVFHKELDSHPTASTYERIAKQLAADLNPVSETQ